MSSNEDERHGAEEPAAEPQAAEELLQAASHLKNAAQALWKRATKDGDPLEQTEDMIAGVIERAEPVARQITHEVTERAEPVAKQISSSFLWASEQLLNWAVPNPSSSDDDESSDEDDNRDDGPPNATC